ncbi:MAG: glycerophosphodiester phosphodiesterase [Myxococcota bacterium]
MTAKPLVIAHRGASAYRPENTHAAYELAVAQGADMIEVDLHRTRDGEVVITHDAELERLGGSGEVADSDLHAMRALDAGEGERIPVLEEMLDAFGAQIPFNLELKRSSEGGYEGMPARAWRAVSERGLVGGTLFSSFYDPDLAELRERAPDARIALLLSRRFPTGALDRARKLGAEALNPALPLVDAELVRSAHGEGLAVYVFTVDEPDDMRRMLDLGVNGLFTNRPDVMRALVDSAGDR